jgi:hypothetical protein
VLVRSDFADLVAELHAAGKSRETIRKTKTAVAMVLDHERVSPNPTRDPAVKLPREEREEPQPPSAEQAEAVYRLLPPKHRLALLWLDWSGAWVGSVDHTLVGDYDEQRRRVRLSPFEHQDPARSLGRASPGTSRGHRSDLGAPRGP